MSVVFEVVDCFGAGRIAGYANTGSETTDVIRESLNMLNIVSREREPTHLYDILLKSQGFPQPRNVSTQKLCPLSQCVFDIVRTNQQRRHFPPSEVTAWQIAEAIK